MRGRTIRRATVDELRKFVSDYCDGVIWTNWDVRESNVTMVFLPIAMGAFSGWRKPDLEQIGAIYGNTRDHKTIPGRALNGYPIFLVMGIMHRDDWEIVKPAISAELERRKTIEIEIKIPTPPGKRKARK